MARFLNQLTAVSLAALGMYGCVPAESSDEEEATEIEMHIDSELTSELAALADPTEIEMFLCRRGDLSEKIFSLRSFEGRLCQDRWVSGLKLVGGAALLICWDNDIEEFQASNCAEKALDDYGLTTIDKPAVVSQMSAIIMDYEAQAGAAGNTYYSGAKTLFCMLPKALLGPGEITHDLWCGP